MITVTQEQYHDLVRGITTCKALNYVDDQGRDKSLNLNFISGECDTSRGTLSIGIVPIDIDGLDVDLSGLELYCNDSKLVTNIVLVIILEFIARVELTEEETC